MPGPLPIYMTDYITQLIALGDTKPAIIQKVLTRYGRKIHPTTIINIKKRNRNNISDARDVIAASADIIGPAALKQKAYRLINKRIDRAEDDEGKIQELRNQLRAGEIDRDEFDKQVVLYERMTINELIKVTDSMHNQSKSGDDEKSLTQADQAALQMLVNGINTGNPLQLIQVLNPTQNNLIIPNVNTQAPPAGTAAP